MTHQKLVVVAFLISIYLAPDATGQQIAPLPVDKALDVKIISEFSPVRLSPDGKWVAYALRKNSSSRTSALESPETFFCTGVFATELGSNIFISDVATSETRSLEPSKGENWLPTWSPDGRYVAFLSDRDGSAQAKLWLWELASNRLRKLSDIPVRARKIEWTANSQELLTTVQTERLGSKGTRCSAESSIQTKAMSNDADGTHAVVYRALRNETKTVSSDPWNLDDYECDLALFNAVSGAVRIVDHGHRITRFSMSPDSERIAIAIPVRFEEAGSQQILYDLVVVSFQTGSHEKVATSIRLDYDARSFSWSPDGSRLAYLKGGPLEKTDDCFVINLGTGDLREIFSPLPRLGDYLTLPPIWDPKGEKLFFIHNEGIWQASVEHGGPSELARIPGRRIIRPVAYDDKLLWLTMRGQSTVVLTYDDTAKQDGFYEINLANGQSKVLLERGECYYCGYQDKDMGVSFDGAKFVYSAQDARHPVDLWLVNRDFEHPKRLTHINPQFDEYQMGLARVIEWYGLDGEKLQGVLLLPAGYQQGEKYPLIVDVYGGLSRAHHVEYFGLEGEDVNNRQILATRGYAVLLPDAPQKLATPMLDLVKTVLPGVNKVIEMGIADPTRLGIIGHSYGGYSVLSLIVQTTRFKAAVMSAGYGDLIGRYGEMGKDGSASGPSSMETGQGLMGGTPWQFRERYIENSPLYDVDRITTPLLILHGGEDRVVVPFLADEVFVMLRRLGKDVVYVKYEGEGHTPFIWRYEDQIDYTNRIINWLDDHLKKPEDKADTEKQKPH